MGLQIVYEKSSVRSLHIFLNAKHFYFRHFFLSFFVTVKLKFIYSEKATKFCEISNLLLTVCTVVKSKVEISQNFVAYSEYMNFTNQIETNCDKSVRKIDRRKMDDIAELHEKRYHNSHSRTLNFKRISRPYSSTKGDLTRSKSPQRLPRYFFFHGQAGFQFHSFQMRNETMNKLNTIQSRRKV